MDSDSLRETKNWGGRNEVIEPSGRIHPSWPQNKRLRTPRTTDRLHTRQDKWIQTELAFTPAKNATKPNPFKIIPLHPTRKENNWEIEETMERATVNLETERAKWPNPGCLWWWWWNSTCFGQFLCPSSGVFHYTHSNGICRTGLLTACKQDQDGTSWSCSQAVSKHIWHIPFLCVQWKTPDDGQRNCPKHVEFYSKINLRNLPLGY